MNSAIMAAKQWAGEAGEEQEQEQEEQAMKEVALCVGEEDVSYHKLLC